MRRLGAMIVSFALGMLGIVGIVNSPGASAVTGPATHQVGSGLQDEQQFRAQHDVEFRKTHADAAGALRPDLWLQGVQQYTAMRAPAARSALAPAAAGVVGSVWTQVGPAPLRIDSEQNFQGAGPDSGQVTDIAIDPTSTTDKTVYIATNDGGIWKTTNGDAAPNLVSWSPLTDLMPSNSMGAVALDPGNPSTVYAGTGNYFNNGYFRGVGVYRSSDGGATWNIPPGSATLTGLTINRIVLPATNVLLVGTNGGLFKSVDGGSSYGNNAPAFNNGASITGGFISDIDLDSATSGTVYVSTGSGTLLKSTDSGTTLGGNIFDATIPAGSRYVSFAQSASSPNVMYASVQKPPATDAAGNPLPNSGGIYRSVNGTSASPTWADVPAGTAQAAGCQCGYDQTIAVDPQDSKTIYIGFQELYASTDGGTTFPKVSANKIHFDHHALVFQPASHRSGTTHLWVGTDGGVSETSDKGATFANPNEGIATNLFRGIDIGRGSAANRGYTYGGTQDTGIIEHRPSFPGNNWHLNRDGDGGFAAVDPCNPSHAISSDNGGYAQTTDGGATPWPLGGHGFTYAGLGVELFDPSCTNAYVALSATGIKAGQAPPPTTQLWQSKDNTATFSNIHTFASAIQTMAMTAADPNTMWVGLADGTVQRTSNLLSGTASTWTAHTVTGAPASQPVGSPGGIAIDPTDTNTVVVTYEGFTGTPGTSPTKHAFRSTDNGAKWSDTSGTDGIATDRLPDLPTHSVVIDPNTTPHGIIVSDDAGVLRSSDNGASWQVLGTGLPTVDAVQLRIDPSATPTLLRVGTYGRSTFELTGTATADLSVTKSASPATVAAGGDVNHLITVRNAGPDDANNAAMDDPLPVGTTFVSETHPAGWSCVDPGVGSAGTVHCTIGSLSTGAGDQVFSVVVRVSGTTAGGTVVANTARVSSSTTDPNRTNNAATATTLVKRATVLAYDGDVTADYHDPATLSATLRDALSGAPIPGQTVNLTLGSQGCAATTLADGRASCVITLNQASGTYNVHAAFAETTTLFGASTDASFQITTEETTLTYTGTAFVANGTPATLTAVLNEDGAVPIEGRTVDFVLGTGASAQPCKGAVTDATGTARCVVGSVAQPDNTSFTVGVTAAFNGDRFYRPSAASSTLVLEYMTGRVFGISAGGLATVAPTPDTGAVATAQASTTTTPCTLTVSGLISSKALCANVTTSLNPGASKVTASADATTVGVMFLPVISIGAVRSDSTTTCGGSNGSITIASLAIGGTTVIASPTAVAPNTTVNAGLAKVVLNEQIPIVGPERGLTVNAVHITAFGGLVDVVVASSSSDIGHCPS